MQVFITTIFILAQMAGGAPAESASEHIGQITEIVVTAPRYDHEDEAWAGLMETVIVTASRYEYEDEAWAGLMETVVVAGQRYDGGDANIAGMTNHSTNQSLGRESNFPSFLNIRAQVYFMILGAMILIIVRFLIPSFLFKSRKPANEVCYCENGQ
jgi:hypothetical protein